MQQWAKTQYQQLLPLHLRVYMSHPKCDPQSTCVIAAGELMKCMTRDHARSRDREEALLKILNHEGVLDSPSLYNTLALLTIHEAVQLTLQSGDESTQSCLILEELKQLECKLSRSPYRQPPADQVKNAFPKPTQHYICWYTFILVTFGWFNKAGPVYAASLSQTCG